MVAPFLSAPARTGRPRRWPLRRVLHGVLHMLRHLRTLRAVLRLRRDALADALRRHLGPGCLPHIPAGTLRLPERHRLRCRSGARDAPPVRD